MNISAGHLCPVCSETTYLFGTSMLGARWCECTTCGHYRDIDAEQEAVFHGRPIPGRRTLAR